MHLFSRNCSHLRKHKYRELVKHHMLEKKITCLAKYLLAYCPNYTLSTWRNSKWTNISIILPASKLNISGVHNSQIYFFMLHRFYVLKQLYSEHVILKLMRNLSLYIFYLHNFFCNWATDVITCLLVYIYTS